MDSEQNTDSSLNLDFSTAETAPLSYEDEILRSPNGNQENGPQIQQVAEPETPIVVVDGDATSPTSPTSAGFITPTSDQYLAAQHRNAKRRRTGSSGFLLNPNAPIFTPSSERGSSTGTPSIDGSGGKKAPFTPRHTDVQLSNQESTWISDMLTSLELSVTPNAVNMNHSAVERVQNSLLEKKEWLYPPSYEQLQWLEQLLTLGTTRLNCTSQMQSDLWIPPSNECSKFLAVWADMATDFLNESRKHKRIWLPPSRMEDPLRAKIIEVRELGTILSYVSHKTRSRVVIESEKAAITYRELQTPGNLAAHTEQEMLAGREIMYLCKMAAETEFALHLCSEVENKLNYHCVHYTRYKQRVHEAEYPMALPNEPAALKKLEDARAEDRKLITDLTKDLKECNLELAKLQALFSSPTKRAHAKAKSASSADPKPTTSASKAAPVPVPTPVAPFVEGADLLVGYSIHGPFHILNTSAPFEFKLKILCKDGVERDVCMVAASVRHAYDAAMAKWFCDDDWVKTLTATNVKDTIDLSHKFYKAISSDADLLGSWEKDHHSATMTAAFTQRINYSKHLQWLLANMAMFKINYLRNDLELGTGVDPRLIAAYASKDFKGSNMLGIIMQTFANRFAPQLEHEVLRSLYSAECEKAKLLIDTMWRAPNVLTPAIREKDIQAKINMLPRKGDGYSDDAVLAQTNKHFQVLKQQHAAAKQPCVVVEMRKEPPAQSAAWPIRTQLITAGSLSNWPTLPKSAATSEPSATSTAQNSLDTSQASVDDDEPEMLQNILRLTGGMQNLKDFADNSQNAQNTGYGKRGAPYYGRGRGGPRGRGRGSQRGGGRFPQPQQNLGYQHQEPTKPKAPAVQRPETALVEELDKYIRENREDILRVADHTFFPPGCFKFGLPHYTPDITLNEPPIGRKYPADDNTLLYGGEEVPSPFAPFPEHIDFLNPKAFRKQVTRNTPKLWSGRISDKSSYYLGITGDNSACMLGGPIYNQSYADHRNGWPIIEGLSDPSKGTVNMRWYHGQYIWSLLPQAFEKFIILKTVYDWVDLYEMHLRTDLYSEMEVELAIDKMIEVYFGIIKRIRSRCPNSKVIWVFGTPVTKQELRAEGDTGEAFNKIVQKRIQMARRTEECDVSPDDFDIFDPFALFCNLIRDEQSNNTNWAMNIEMRKIVNGLFLTPYGRTIFVAELMRLIYLLTIKEQASNQPQPASSSSGGQH